MLLIRQQNHLIFNIQSCTETGWLRKFTESEVFTISYICICKQSILEELLILHTFQGLCLIQELVLISCLSVLYIFPINCS